MAGELVLLGTWESTFAMRVRIALAEKGVKYEYKEEDLKNKSPLLLGLYPIHNGIPVLIHNGNAISESTVILQYIDEVWHEHSQLLPSDPYERAQARFLVDFTDKKMYATWSRLWLSEGEEHETAKKELLGIIKHLEGALGDRSFYGGDSFGFLDVGLIPFSSWFHTFETYGHFKMEKEFPKLMAWVKRCVESKESVSKTLPDEKKVYEYILALEKNIRFMVALVCSIMY